MSDRAKWIGGGMVVAVLIVIAITAARFGGYDPTPRSALVGQEAPSFELPVVAGDGVGDRVDLSALRGEVVALDFWASWCGPCRRSIPALNSIHERYGSRVRLYGVNVEASQPPARIQQAHRTFAAAFPSLHDERHQAQAEYGVQSIPTLVLIDRQGMIRHLETGVPDAGDVGDILDDLLAE